jgi:hypothetical protein
MRKGFTGLSIRNPGVKEISADNNQATQLKPWRK